MKAGPSDINLRCTLAAANGAIVDTAFPHHHPISCRSDVIVLEEDGRMGCEHGYAAADDPRTQACIDHSISILLIELAVEREASHVPG